jgi:hypothetical protein
MTDAEYVAIEIAKHYGLDPVLFMHASAFLSAVGKALKMMTPDEIVAGMRAKGELTGLTNPYGGVIARIRRLSEEHALRERIAADQLEAARWNAVGNAANRGETLAGLVADEQLFPDEAEATLVAEFADEDLRDIALEAFRGRRA